MKRKRGRMVYDEVAKDWKPRWGTGRVQKEFVESDWIKEIPNNKSWDDVPFADSERSQKKARVKKNQKQEEKNRKHAMQAMGNVAPGVQFSTKAFDKTKTKLPNEVRKTMAKTAQVSTASMGKFDKLLPGEHKLNHGKKKLKAVERDFTDAERNKRAFDRLFRNDDGLDVKHATRIHATQAQKSRTSANSSAARLHSATDGKARKGGKGKGSGSSFKGGKGKGKGSFKGGKGKGKGKGKGRK